MIIKFILCSVVTLVCGYNLDTDDPIIYWHDGDSYFGYSVLLYSSPDNNTSWVIIGAPKGNYSQSQEKRVYPKEPGIVYKCQIGESTCTNLPPSITEDQEGFISQVGMKMIIRKQEGWLGSAMSIDKSKRILTVCAPRTIISIFNYFESSKSDTMQGMCYSASLSSLILYMEDKNLATYDFSARFWYNPLHGFSIHYASARKSLSNLTNEVYRIIGEPMHEVYGTVDMRHSTRRISVDLPVNDDLSEFGYSVTGGYFFQKDQLLYASGAPGWRYVGQVAIINPMAGKPVVASVYGNEIGEFFGGSLASGDINNDGLDDLLVGAPHFANDNGKVYLYLGSTKKQFVSIPSLRGSVEAGYFGYSIACGDLDADGFADIIVGAPWEDNGVIYIYNGAGDLGERDNIEVSQRISAVESPWLNLDPTIKRFGFALSEPVDIDDNGYADIAIGAYKTGYAVVLRSKPVVKTQLSLQFIPHILQRNAKEFVVKVCPKYEGYDMEHSREFKVSLTLDEKHRRTKETYLELKSSQSTDLCLYCNVTILDHVRDFIEPLVVMARHDFLYENATDQFCKRCPVENRSNKMHIVQESLAFDIGCGEDKVCSADISANASFHGVQYNDTWIIGSDGISLEVILENLGEPAYLMNLVFTFPERIMLRSILPSCQEDESGSILMLTCDVGNPLGQGEKKVVKLDLDMRHLNNGSMHDSELKFLANINSRSTNRGLKEIEKVLNLVSEVSLSLNGKANEESYYLSSRNEELANVSFQHIYQVYKLGMTPIEKARFVVHIPTAIRDSDTLVYIYKPQLYVSGELYECSSDDTLLLDPPRNESRRKSSSQSQSQQDVSLNFEESTVRSHKVYAKEIRKSDTEREYLSVVLQEMQSLYRPAYSEHNEGTFTEIIYFNCTSPNVNCSTIICDLSSLRTLVDVGKVLLRLVLDTRALKGSSREDTKVFRFSTQARVEVIAPDTSIAVSGSRSIMDVVTVFYSVPEFKQLQVWIIVLSVSVGLLLLLIVVTILSTLGFFKRGNKEKLSALKNKEASMIDINREDENVSTNMEDT